MLFAFLISLTPDINVNHKYVMISYAFVTVFLGMGSKEIFFCQGKTKWKKWSCKVACVILCICLIGTGVYDFVVILLDNDSAHRMTVDMGKQPYRLAFFKPQEKRSSSDTGIYHE